VDGAALPVHGRAVGIDGIGIEKIAQKETVRRSAFDDFRFDSKRLNLRQRAS
jgi:hypothetical protein